MSKQYDQYLSQLEAALAAQRNPSALENNLSGDWRRNRGWLLKGDWKNGQDIGAITNLAPVAGQYREGQMRNPNGDNVAMGVRANPYANKLANADMTNAAWAGAYEDTVGGVQNENTALSDTLQSLYSDRMQKGIQGADMLLKAYNNRPKSGWKTFLSSL